MLEILKSLRDSSRIDPIANRRAYQAYSITLFILTVWGLFLLYLAILVMREQLVTRLIVFVLGIGLVSTGIVLFPRKKGVDD